MLLLTVNPESVEDSLAVPLHRNVLYQRGQPGKDHNQGPMTVPSVHWTEDNILSKQVVASTCGPARNIIKLDIALFDSFLLVVFSQFGVKEGGERSRL